MLITVSGPLMLAGESSDGLPTLLDTQSPEIRHPSGGRARPPRTTPRSAVDPAVLG